MSQDRQTMPDRPFPKFLEEWREVNGPDFPPTGYLAGTKGSAASTLAAQWLFRPNFVEYRGGVFRSEFTDLGNESRKYIDEWIDHRGIMAAEEMSNLTTLEALFSSDDLKPYEDDFPYLAESVAQCWRGLLGLQFPEREFVVTAEDYEAAGMQVTFYTKPTGQEET